jgi:hypothetical protein
MDSSNESPAHLIAQGWTMMFLLFLSILLMEFMSLSVEGNLREFQGEQGVRQVRVLVVLMVLHAVMPLLILRVDAPLFRWCVAVFAGMLTLAMAGHQWVHVIKGDKPMGVLHLLDLVHHALGTWMTAASVQWARRGRACLPQRSMPVASMQGR